ncbi:hypothetical protein J6590_008106 [Homalodisca vitripennis]|nr:hypothetical protein J6590_008106 [Homalodisca vitripennis]
MGRSGETRYSFCALTKRQMSLIKIERLNLSVSEPRDRCFFQVLAVQPKLQELSRVTDISLVVRIGIG